MGIDSQDMYPPPPLTSRPHLSAGLGVRKFRKSACIEFHESYYVLTDFVEMEKGYTN